MMCSLCDKSGLLQKFTILITTVLLLKWNSILAQNIPTYYLDDYCSRVLDMTMANVKSGRLMLHRPGQNPIYPSCHILIKAPTNKRLSFKFHSFDVESPQGCTSNFLRIFEDHRREFPISDKLCNSGKTPDRAFITNGDEAAVWLNKERYLLDQVELVFTAFSFSPCLGGDYQCDNDHCISSDLYCNDDYDNCGDESDICLIKHGTVVGIIVAVVILAVVLAILLALYMVRRQRKIRREKVANILSLSQDQRSQLSFLSDGKSSMLRKQPSILSHGSGSIMRYPGIRTVAFTGTKAHSFDYLPLAYTTSPMSSQYSTLTRDGVVLGSNLGEKTRSSIKSKPSKKSVEQIPKSSIRSEGPGELRPPFFFDKDGYFSDSSASQTNSLDKYDRSRQSSLDATDAKKKRKFMGRLKKKKAKKGKDEQPHASTSYYTGERGRLNHAFRDDKDMPGREQMTEDLYIDGKQLVNTVDIPQISITHPEESNNHADKDRTLSKDSQTVDNRNNFGWKRESNEVPAGTSVKSAEALNLLMERRKAASDEVHRSEISPLKIHPRTVTASAVVHRQCDRAQDAVSLTGNGNDIIETIVETPSSGHDTVDGANQPPTHISLLTLPDKSSEQTQRESIHSVANTNTNTYTYNDIETIVLNSPASFDAVDNKNQNPTHVSILTLPEPSTSSPRRIGQRKSGGDITTSNSSGEDEVDGYPRTNLQLADQALRPMSRSYQDLSSSLSTTAGRPRSPTRQMGLSARHPDGSPFLLHKASPKMVRKQLKQHPEDRPNVRDHVISFRSYPSPVHSLERAGLFRNSSMRSAGYSDTKTYVRDEL